MPEHNDSQKRNFPRKETAITTFHIPEIRLRIQYATGSLGRIFYFDYNNDDIT